MTTEPTNKRIVLTGASGVGKTSLALLLEKRANLKAIPEVARTLCARSGYASPTEIPDAEKFKNEVLDEQIALEDQLNSFIADRGTIDAWVMWQRWQICSAMTYDTEAYYEKCRAQANKYTHVIYVPPLFTPVEDAFRWTDNDYIKQIDRLTRTTLYDWSLWNRTYTIQADELTDRVEEVMEWLDSTRA